MITIGEQRKIEESARGIARSIGQSVPRGVGFALLLFTFDQKPDEDGFLTWISNAERDDMLAAMKEFIARNEGRAVAPSKGGRPV
jgi:hypothetical protein